MGCGASNNAAASEVAGTVAKPATPPNASPTAAAAESKHAAVGTRAAGFGSQTVEQVETLAEKEPDSPTTVRISDKKKKQDPFGDDILTVEEEDGPASPAGADVAKQNSEAQKPKPKPKAVIQQIESSASSDPRLARDWSTKADVAPVLTVSGSIDEADTLRLAPPSMAEAGPGPGSWGYGGKDDDDLVILKGPPVPKEASSHGAAGAAKRYDDITLSDDDSDDDSGGFDLHRWKRFYHWNRRKPAELMKFLWKKFDNKQYSVYCVSYRDQEKIFAAFQADNILNGLNCRLETAGFELFGIVHTLFDFDNTIYKLVGAVIVKGQEPPPQWKAMPDFDDYCFVKADTRDPLVRQFVSSLLTSVSPVPQYSIVATKEFII